MMIIIFFVNRLFLSILNNDNNNQRMVSQLSFFSQQGRAVPVTMVIQCYSIMKFSKNVNVIDMNAVYPCFVGSV